MSKRMHVLFLTTRLHGGGAEMHMIRVVNHLPRDQFQISVATLRAGGDYEALLEPDVGRYVLYQGTMQSTTWSLLQSALPLRKLLRELRPDVLCAILDGPGVLASMVCRSLADPPKLVTSVQCSISEVYAPWHPVRRAILAGMKRWYPHADKVIAISYGVANDMYSHIPQVRNHTQVIYNASVDDRVLKAAKLTPTHDPARVDGPLVVACGRLTAQKGFDDLLKAYQKVHSRCGGQLWILGTGEDRDTLTELAGSLGIGGNVRLLGFQPNPYAFMASADLFVLSSRFEGLGMVVAEAMASGAPVVSTDCPHGPAEILRDSESGLLVPVSDPDALADAMLRVLKDESIARRLRERGHARAADFHARNIAAEYGRLFQGLLEAPTAAPLSQGVHRRCKE